MIFDAKFPYKLSYFELLCLLTKMAAKTMKSCIRGHFEYSVKTSRLQDLLYTHPLGKQDMPLGLLRCILQIEI